MNAHVLLALPVLIPLATAMLGVLARGNRVAQRVIGVTGAAALLAAAVALFASVQRDGVLVVQMGDWPAPFGITFVADGLAAILVLFTAVTGLAIAVFSLATMDAKREHFGYYPLVHLLLLGVVCAFLTGDVFNLFVWFEVLLLASFVLLALGGGRAQMEGAMKYVILNLVSSALFLSAIGLLYGVTGTLNMADLSVKLADVDNPGLVTTIGMLMFIAFGIKAALFPLFFWLPASYHTPPLAVTALFAGLLTKVGVYAIIRMFTLVFTQDVAFTHTVILVVAGFTMVTGVLGAVAQSEVRRLLSFHIISQIGYMIMGLALMTPLALAGAIFHIVHNMVVKTNLFLVSGVAHHYHGSYDLKKLGGLYASAPLLAILFLVSALALAGLPPFSGFFSKLALVRAGLEVESYAIVAAALAVGLLTLFSMTKIWAEAFWKPLPGGADAAAKRPRQDPRVTVALLAPIIVLAALAVGMGLFAEPLFDLLIATSTDLLDKTAYVEAVLGVDA